MLARLLKRGEMIARAQQRRTVQSVATELRRLLGNGAVEVEEGVAVRGKGVVRRWLVDPDLRFLGRVRR